MGREGVSFDAERTGQREYGQVIEEMRERTREHYLESEPAVPDSYFQRASGLLDILSAVEAAPKQSEGMSEVKE